MKPRLGKGVLKLYLPPQPQAQAFFPSWGWGSDRWPGFSFTQRKGHWPALRITESESRSGWQLILAPDLSSFSSTDTSKYLLCAKLWLRHWLGALSDEERQGPWPQGLVLSSPEEAVRTCLLANREESCSMSMMVIKSSSTHFLISRPLTYKMKKRVAGKIRDYGITKYFDFLRG